jgi:molybdopterin molybdotransferase
MTADASGSLIADVRMRGFARRTTVEAALAWVDAHARRLAAERASVWEAAGRVLSGDVTSPVDVPQFARSMMDGYALVAADTLGATAYHRLPLTVIGQSLPGRPFAGAVARGQAVRIMTGAPLPAGADAVLPAERCELEGATLLALDEVPPGKNVGSRGEDVRDGAVVLAGGRVLRPQDAGLLSAIGCGEVEVVRRPRVRIVITGDELLPAGSRAEDARDGRIVDANGPMLAALVARDGGVACVPPLALEEGRREGGPFAEDPRPNPFPEREGTCYLIPDDPAAILAALREPADVVLVSGGSSVGQEDHAPLLLARHGELAIHGIAMRPSSPTGMGRMDGKLVFLLPGNPVSCLCAYDFFAGRAIRLLGGRRADWPYISRRLPLESKLVSQVGRVDYARVRIVAGQVEPISISGASILTSTTTADGFVVVPADSEGYAAGTEVEVWMYD